MTENMPSINDRQSAQHVFSLCSLYLILQDLKGPPAHYIPRTIIEFFDDVNDYDDQ
jgi:hypothetical protein